MLLPLLPSWISQHFVRLRGNGCGGCIDKLHVFLHGVLPISIQLELALPWYTTQVSYGVLVFWLVNSLRASRQQPSSGHQQGPQSQRGRLQWELLCTGYICANEIGDFAWRTPDLDEKVAARVASAVKYAFIPAGKFADPVEKVAVRVALSGDAFSGTIQAANTALLLAVNPWTWGEGGLESWSALGHVPGGEIGVYDHTSPSRKHARLGRKFEDDASGRYPW